MKKIARLKGFAVKDLPAGLNKADDGDWVCMSAEVPPEDEGGGDVIRIGGMAIRGEIPLLAQHLRCAPDGSPTNIGKVVEATDATIMWKGKPTKAKLGRFVWADGELAAKYKSLWPEFINTVSIGAFIKDGKPLDEKNPWGGWDITQCELFELSVVSVPANPAAGVLRTIQNALGDELDPPIHIILKDINDSLTSLYSKSNDTLLSEMKKLNARLDKLEALATVNRSDAAEQSDDRSSAPDLSKVIEALSSLKARL